MKKALRIHSMLLMVCLFSIFALKTQAQTVWDGTADISWYASTTTTYDISTAEQLAGLAQLVNSGTADFTGVTFNLTEDLWLNATGDSTNNWIPIGGSATATGETSGNPYYFRGTFHGKGHTIYNMYCEKSNYFQAGLFGAVASCYIDSLAMINPIVTSKGMMGAIVGFSGSGSTINIISCIAINARITGTGGNNIGAIIGANYSNYNGTNVTNCGATGLIMGNYIGGLGGNSQYVTYSNCYFAGNLIGAPNGGICGYSGTTNNCYTNYASGSNTHTGETITSDAYMLSDSIIENLGDAFMMDCAINNGYPVLSWQTCGVPVNGALELCAGESTTLEAYGYDSYLWSTGATTASITVTPSTTTDYYVTGTKNEGNIVITDTITVTVYPQAVITATAMPAADGIVHGVITPSNTTVACGSSDVVNLTITPDYGWHISRIVVNGQTVREDDPTDGDVVTYTVDPNGTLCDVKVYFSNVYTITASIMLTDNTPLNNSSLVTPWGDNGVYAGTATEDVVYTFNSTVRYHLTDVLIDGVSQGAITTYTFASLDQTHTVSAIYQDTCGLFSLPIFMDFENSPENGYSSTPACWTKTSTYTAYPYIYNYDQIAHNSNAAMYFSNSSYSGYSQIAMPAIDTVNVAPIRDLQIKFWFRTSATSTPMQVGVMTDPASNGTFTPVATIYANEANVYEQKTVYMSNYTGDGQYIAFKFASNDYASGYIDDLEIALAPDCSPVQNLAVDSTTGNGDIYLSWTDGVIGSPISYTVEYRDVNDDEWTSEIAYDNTYTLNGLSTGASYIIRVSQDCGSSEPSEFSYTECFLPCSEEEQCEYTLTVLPGSSYAASYAKFKVYFGETYMFDFNATRTLSVCSDINVRFVLEQEYTSSSYALGLKISDPYGIEIANYAAGSVPSNGISITTTCEAPSCTRPENVTAENVEMNSAEISWTVDEDNTATSFIVEYGLAGFTPGNGTIEIAGSSPYIINNLTEGTNYDVLVYSDCGGDTSVASDRISFQTPVCDDYCMWTFNLNDSYGDGWNGNILHVFNGAVEVATLTIDNGHTAVYDVPMCNNDTVTLTWTNGSYISETSFTVTDPYGLVDLSFSGSDINNNAYSAPINCEAPTCTRPENVSALNIGQNDADITWTAADENDSEWLINYTANGNTNAVVANSNPFTLTGLTANTVYSVTVATLCNGGADTSMFTNAITFRTACGTIDSLPYTQDFEDGTYTDGQYDWIACWSKYASNSEHPMYINNSSYYAHGGSHYIDAHYTPSCYNIAIMPELNDAIDVSALTLKFYARRTGSTAIFEIGVMDNASDHTTFTVLDTLNPDNDWAEMEYILSGYQGTGKYIAFRVSNGQGCGIYIDDLVLDYTPACVHPTDFAIDNLTTTDVTLHWREQGTANAWNVEYSNMNFTPGTGVGTAVMVTDTFYDVTGLMASTTYYAYVQSDCGNGEGSEWEGPITFTTACAPYDIPYLVNFDNISTWSVPNCWHKLESPNMTGATYTYNDIAASGSNALRIETNAGNYYAWAELPLFTTPIDSLSISFKLYKSYGTRPFFVGIYTTDVNSIVILDTISDATTSWNDYTVNLNGYTGNGGNIVIGISDAYNDYCRFYVDDIVVDYLNDCLFPSNVTVSNISDVEATIAWVERGEATDWEIEYGAPGFTEGNGTVVTATSTPFTLTGLTASTNYEVHVRSICDLAAGTYSAWSSTIAFRTSDCAAADQCTYTINMADSYGDGWNGASLSVMSGATTLVSASASGSSSTATFQACDLSTITLTWNSGSYDNEASFNIVDANGNTIVDVPDVTTFSTTTFVANCSGAVIVDTCDAPTALTINNVAQTTATATWTAGGSETAWVLEYKTSAGLDWTSVSVTGTPSYNFTGLNTNTQYFVRVKADCGNGSNSDWSLPTSFTTLDETVEVCPAPTNLTAVDVRNEEVDITWNQEANTANSWDVKYRVQGTAAWSSVSVASAATTVNYTLTGLAGLTTYEIQVVAHCNNGLTSDPSNTITVTTKNVGVDAYDLDRNVSVYPNPTAGLFVIENSELMINRVEVYDVYGKLMNVVEVNDTQVTMNASNYAAGTYFVRVYTENGMVTKRIVKR